jgi:hypothetical protein
MTRRACYTGENGKSSAKTANLTGSAPGLSFLTHVVYPDPLHSFAGQYIGAAAS